MPDPQRILVVQPTWVGDAVMATPTLRALRNRYPNAQITYLIKRYVKAMYAGIPWADKRITYRSGKSKAAGSTPFLKLIARLKKRKFDLAVVLPGSFKSALLCRMAGIKEVVGYDRDGRGFLLTGKLLPSRLNGKYVPTPIIKYYLGLAKFLGASDRDLTMQLFVTPAEQRQADGVYARANIPPHRPRVILNPGAQYGSSKCWQPEYFAQLADELVEKQGATILISTAPKERWIVEEIRGHMKHPAIDLAAHGMSLGALKAIIRDCDLMVTNDTGPRHIAAAFGVPVVSIFGPTHPEWTEIYFKKERIVRVPVHCGPCQLKVCPLDHRCMTRVTPPMVLERCEELLPTASS